MIHLGGHIFNHMNSEQPQHINVSRLYTKFRAIVHAGDKFIEYYYGAELIFFLFDYLLCLNLFV